MRIKISYNDFNNYKYSFLEHAINAEIGTITTKELQHKKKRTTYKCQYWYDVV